MNDCVPHFFLSEEIATIMNNPNVILNQNKLSEKHMVHFSIPLSDNIKTKLEKIMNVPPSSIPMTWVRGDTFEHIDQGTSPFESTFLIYLTDSVGQFIVDGQNYSINAGNAHIFSEGLSHSTLHTENDRLMMGPMSEKGLPVGGVLIPVIYYYSQDSNTQQPDCRIEYESKYFLNQPFQAYILNIPSPGQELNIVVETDVYTAVYSNGTGLDNIWAPPSGKTFGGWKLLMNKNNPVIGYNTPDKIYMPGEIFTYTESTSLLPNWIDLPVPSRSFKLHFTNNSTVYYKSNSLSTGSGGSGVRNYRHKQRKT
jgi:hypothetical protein